MTAVERGRLGVAARSVGVAQACLEDSVAYARERTAFGRTIAEFQLVQSKITDMAVGAATARPARPGVRRGARARRAGASAHEHGEDVRVGRRRALAADAVQIHGAAGVARVPRVGRMYRDAKVLQIVEGSNDAAPRR